MLFSLFLALLAISVVIIVALTIYATRYRDIPEARLFRLILLGSLLWAGGYLLELLSPTLQGKIFWDNVQFLGIDVASLAWLLFGCAYTGRHALATRLERILWIYPLISTAIIWSDPWHGWLRPTYGLISTYALPLLEYDYGPAAYLIFLAGYLLTFTGYGMLIVHLWYVPHAFRLRLLMIITGAFIPVLGGLLTIFGLVPIPNMPHLDIAPLTLIVAYPLLAWAIFRQQAIEIIPIARDTLIERMPDGVLVIDGRQRIVDHNQQALHLLSTTGTILHQPLGGVAAAIAALLPTDPDVSAVHDELICERSDPPRCLEVTLTRLDTTQARPPMLGWLIIIRDITRRRLAETRLRESEELLRETQQVARVGGWEVDLASGSVTATEETRRIYESEVDTVMSFPETNQFYSSADQEMLRQAHAQLQHDSTPIDVELPMTTMRGNRRYVRLITHPRYDSNGTLVRMHGTVQDITDRYLAEQQRRVSEELLHAIIDNVPAVVTVRDLQGTYLLVSHSAADALDKQVHEIIGRNFRHFYPADVVQCLRDITDRVVASRGLVVEEVTLPLVHGQRDFLMVSFPLFNEQGAVYAISSVATDITQRKRDELALQEAKEAAEAANRAKSEFLASMSHELRTPLNAVLGFAQVLLNDEGLTSRQREYLTMIDQSGTHLLSLINDVLEMSRIEAGRLEIASVPFDLHALHDEVQAIFQKRAAQRGLQLLSGYSAAVPRHITGDPSRLRQVIFNLLENAIKFTRRGTITLAFDYQLGHLVVSVEDTGIGIAPDRLLKVFDVFVRDSSQAYASEGTGLGLAISKQIVQAMGGTIHVSSTPGRGSRFWFQVPTAPVDMPDNRPQPLPPAPQWGTVVPADQQRAWRILVVEDVSASRKMLAIALERLGFEVRTAANGADALALLDLMLPDAILLDIGLPDIDGYELARMIRAHSHGQDIPIIAVTAHVLEDELQAIREAGCNAVVRKPFRIAAICTELEIYLGVRFDPSSSPVRMAAS